jgi:hypothetical protein
MSYYYKDLVNEFDQANYPLIEEEIQLINKKSADYPLYFKVEMIISFLKDHCLQTSWVKANLQLAGLVTSGTLFTGHIESLFESCRNNAIFRKELESHLKRKFLSF